MTGKLCTWVKSRSHVIQGDEPYGNSYVFVVLRSIDLFVASLFSRSYGVTISSFTGLAMRKDNPPAWAILLGAFLSICQRNHSEEAIAADRYRAQQALQIVGG